MGRAVLAIGAAVWGIAAVLCLAVALAGIDRLVVLLPPLAIDDEALRGALLAVAGGLGIAAGAHVVVLAGLRVHRVARSAAILLSATALAVFVALAAAAFASAGAEPTLATLLVGAGIGALLVSLAYAAATIGFVLEIRRGRS